MSVERPSVSSLQKQYPFAEIRLIKGQPIIEHSQVVSFTKSFLGKPDSLVFKFLGQRPEKYHLSKGYDYAQFTVLDSSSVVHCFETSPDSDTTSLGNDTQVIEATLRQHYLFDGYVDVGFNGNPIVHFKTWKLDDKNWVRDVQSNWFKIVGPLISRYGRNNATITYQKTPDGNCILNCYFANVGVNYCVTLYGDQGETMGMGLKEILDEIDRKQFFYTSDMTNAAALAESYSQKPTPLT